MITLDIDSGKAAENHCGFFQTHKGFQRSGGESDGGRMTEYIEREEVNALIKAECSPKVAAYLIDAVAAIPAADVRPVVFCRDCKHRDPEAHKCDCGQLERAGCVFPVDDDYFCAYGAKREESRAEMRNRRFGND